MLESGNWSCGQAGAAPVAIGWVMVTTPANTPPIRIKAVAAARPVFFENFLIIDFTTGVLPKLLNLSGIIQYLSGIIHYLLQRVNYYSYVYAVAGLRQNYTVIYLR